MIEQLPAPTLEQIKNGEAILFLGAGAAFGSTDRQGEEPLSGEGLRDSLCNKFLGGGFKDKPLAHVAELCKSEASILKVQRHVYDCFEPLQPAQFHNLIPTFRWHSIVTTNYDYIVERAYERSRDRLQELQRKIRNNDDLHDRKTANYLPYLKLHGCLSVVNDEKLPLILASEEYAKFKSNRERLFNIFQDWGRERPILFCGYKLSDPNLQQIFFDLTDLNLRRLPYVLVDPKLRDVELRYWKTHRVIPIKSSFEDFITGLDVDIPKTSRQLSVLRDSGKVSIQSKIVRGKPSSELLTYITTEAEHVRLSMPSDGVAAKDFYRGNSESWAPIQNNLDVHRRITDDLLLEAVLSDEERNASPRMYVVKGYAGSGKSILLRRFAYDAATDYDTLVIWVHDSAMLRADSVKELYQLTDEVPLIVLEDFANHVEEIKYLRRLAKNENFPFTLVMGARTNEWNVSAGELEQQIEDSYDLHNLSDNEIDTLLSKLKQNDCLGELEEKSLEDQRHFFHLTAERQLLVALHEATVGHEFDEIVLNEYENITPKEAKTLYLDICTLHRFNVGVRAGLISRVSGITLYHFKDRLFAPLEHLVSVFSDYHSRDWAYRTRHTVIADVVFRQVLKNQDDRAHQIVRMIRSMNVDFESDNRAFEQLLKGRDIANLFSQKAYGDMIFDAAHEAKASMTHVEHQRAIFELNHPGGRASTALAAIRAASADSDSPTIAHTKAMVLRQLAKDARTNLERDKLRTEAKSVLERFIDNQHSSYFHHLMGELLLDELQDEPLPEDGVEADKPAIRRTTDLLKKTEKMLSEGMQKHPDDTYLRDLEAKLAEFLNDSPRALAALESSFKISPESGFIAVRLSRALKRRGDVQKAKEVLEESIGKNSTNRLTKYLLARTLMEEDEVGNEEKIRSYLRSSFTDGDSNYKAQFWYARQESLFGDADKGKKIFDSLQKANLSPDTKNKIRGVVLNRNKAPIGFRGTVVSTRESYCFVKLEDNQTNVFVHYSNFVDEYAWGQVKIRDNIILNMGFNFKGAAGINAKLGN